MPSVAAPLITGAPGYLLRPSNPTQIIVGAPGVLLAPVLLQPYNGTFASREDITGDLDVPGPNLVLSNTEGGEYLPDGELATQWFTWTSDVASDIAAPVSVEFSFDFAGQSGSGGASLRVYDDTGDVMPVVGDLVDDDSVSGASGSVGVVITPSPATTYYIQRGLQEKAGTVGHLFTTMDWGTDYTPTLVIP